MYLKFDKQQLDSDTSALESKGISKETAIDIAKYKQAIDFATWFQDTFGYFDREEVGDEIYEILDDLNSRLEEASCSISEIFKPEEISETVGAAG